MGHVGLVIEVRRLRQEAAGQRGCDVDVAIAEGLRNGGWIVDQADHAAELQEGMNQRALDGRTQYTGESAEHCQQCDEPIPEGRR
ncbi:hypothetical protein [Halorhodospira halophila]|uniref:hypothetical protein n=1 Tax=Halorhodospira halophila TaxID=1053 RepID=UPI001912D701|nr:hypothetical protein [Halorhodospira halophila]MBK5942731.1 hypothetical protein [Halorhodospira halophila]